MGIKNASNKPAFFIVAVVLLENASTADTIAPCARNRTVGCKYYRSSRTIGTTESNHAAIWLRFTATEGYTGNDYIDLTMGIVEEGCSPIKSADFIACYFEVSDTVSATVTTDKIRVECA